MEDEEGANPDDHDGLGNWGTKKKHFYGGNPNEKSRGGKGKDEVKDGDLDEAEAEAEESKAIQLKQLQELDEEDFFDAFGGDPDLQVSLCTLRISFQYYYLIEKNRLAMIDIYFITTLEIMYLVCT